MAARGPQLRVGEFVPGTKYKVSRWIGAGGMGEVYEVEKEPNLRGVLKLLSKSLSADKGHREQFLDEVRAVGELEHPNIVKVYDCDTLPDGTPFYVMERLTGQTVAQVLTTLGRIPPRVAYEIIQQLLEALQCAHTHRVPIIHRDIKPDNIFLHTPRHGAPLVKLLDFGVSSLGDRRRVEAVFSGTPGYASPEQVNCEPATPASDLYSVALVLYEMLAGVSPFEHHNTIEAILAAQCGETPRPVSDFVSNVPPSIVSLISDALAKDPRARPASAYAFAERLYELQWMSVGVDPRFVTTPQDAPSASPSALAATPPAPAANAKAGPGLSEMLQTAAAARAANRAPSKERRIGTLHYVGRVSAGATSGRSTHDTFSTQESEPRRPSRSRASLVLALAALALVCAVGSTIVVLKRTVMTPATAQPPPPQQPPPQSPPTPLPPPPSATATLPSPTPPMSAEIANVPVVSSPSAATPPPRTAAPKNPPSTHPTQASSHRPDFAAEP